jgi:hypothetical protein
MPQDQPISSAALVRAALVILRRQSVAEPAGVSGLSATHRECWKAWLGIAGPGGAETGPQR